MIANLKELMALAERKNAAVPAFNCYNVESVMAVVRAVRETNAPVIFQLYTRMMDTETGPYVAAAVHEAIRQLKTPAALHLDHGAGIPQVIRALRMGASSVMIGCRLNFSGNTLMPYKAVPVRICAIGSFSVFCTKASNATLPGI